MGMTVAIRRCQTTNLDSFVQLEHLDQDCSLSVVVDIILRFGKWQMRIPPYAQNVHVFVLRITIMDFYHL